MSALTYSSTIGRLLLASCLLLASLPGIAAAADLPLAKLMGFDFKAKSAAITAIADSGSPRAATILGALLDGRLLMRKADSRMVIAATSEPKTAISDALDGSELGSEELVNLKKVVINNQLRLVLRGALARLGLANSDRDARLAAVEALAADDTPGTIAALEDALPKEQDAGVKRAMQVVLALAALGRPEETQRLAAVNIVSGSMLGEVRNRLAALLAKDAEGKPLEPSMDVRVAAARALRAIDERRAHYELVQTIFFGLSLGFVLVLAATGLAITFGVMGVINMAHGEMMMLGAYTTYVVQQAFPNHIEQSLFMAIPAAFLVAAAVGIVIERGIVRFLYGRPLETLLATFGVSLFLQQVVRSVFSPLNRAVATPQWMSGQLLLGDALALTWNRLYIIVFSALVFAALLALLRFTSLGLHVRAVAQNRAMARAMGVRAGWVDALTFGLGSGVAGLAGVALSQLTNVGPNLGQSYIIDSFMVVVFGGVGNLWGTLVAGLSLGIANKFLEPFAGAVLAKILVLVFIILFIQKWPRGLFPQRGRAAEA
ncbi:MAG: urea ABC transporter permease subunit UrtB [Gammaproteobacteria bacterium]|nr:urea ABC transporter permease subunit UrtB [Gammaproteobacteria bacterium]